MKKIILGIGILLLIGIFMLQKHGNSLKEDLSLEQNEDMFPRSSKQKFIKHKADKPGEFLKYFDQISKRPGEKVSGYPGNYRFKEFNKAVSNKAVAKRAASVNITAVTSRGPGNVGGRTRGLILDPTDPTHQTWYAGSASGGIWLTTNAGGNWTNLTPELPNLSTNSLAMALDNGNKIIYAGTGEVFAPNYSFVRGDGIFKSVDGGLTWSQLSSTAGLIDFQSVNGLLVDPNNANVVIAATNSGIFKSIDGGNSWQHNLYPYSAVQDLAVHPTNFNIQYAGVLNRGIFKSTDGGNTWTNSSKGIGDFARFDVDVSPTNPNKVYTSTYNSADETAVYVSSDAGASWSKFEEIDGDNANFLGEQGWYDNIIKVHPYNEDVVFVGGVFIGKMEFGDTGYETERQFLGIDLDGTGPFLSFINFGAPFNGGTLFIGDGGNPSEEFFNVEIRFGDGHQQKAHRFTVPENGGTDGDGGAGVPDEDYSYQDYVTVPFEVWDIDNNRQLMVSFRDNQRDGEFNLNPRDDENDPGLLTAREYLFISNVTYSETPDENISSETATAAHLYQNMYFFWPIAASEFEWGVDVMPESIMRIKYGSVKILEGQAEIVSDPRGNFGGLNSNLHADHHNLIMIPIDESTGEFWILNGNDGGLGWSTDGGETWEQILDGYVTTQFYGADKKPGADQYFGGMQDNGTWLSPENATGPEAEYEEKLGGDGFEVIWHAKEPRKLMGSIYNNQIYRSMNGGQSWSQAQDGIETDEGPFITRLATSRERPETVFAVSSRGILKSTNFGGSWDLKEIEDKWTFVDAESIPVITSQHDVKVSLANADIVWAGGGMTADRQIYVSTDGGETFNKIDNYPDAVLGALSGLATHPTEENTAYALFSFAKSPKVLRTTDLGETWEDISGHVTSQSESTNGFPDVFVHSLLVMPHQPDVIWAGTEIGIFESSDNGASWSYLDVGFPAVSVWSMKVVDDQVVIGTHGRGIWTITIPDLIKAQSLFLTSEYLEDWDINFKVDLSYAFDSIKFYVNGEETYEIKDPETGIQDVLVPSAVVDTEMVEVYFIAFADGEEYKSRTHDIAVDFNPTITDFTQNQEPDPLTNLNLTVEITESYDSLVFFVNDQRVGKEENVTPGSYNSNITIPEVGIYKVHVVGYYEEVAFISNEETLTVSTITGLFTKALESKPLLIYPNPAVDFMAYELPTSISNAYTVEIIDMRGQVVFQKQMLNTLSSNQLNVAPLEKGFYILTVKSEKEVFTQRFMKN